MRTKIKKSVWYFFCGCCFGLILDFIYNKVLKSQNHFIGHNVSLSRYHVEKNAIFNDVKYLYRTDSKEAISLSQQVRVLCWIMTQEKTLLSKAQAVKDTWGKRCDVLVFFSSSADEKFPAIKLDAAEGSLNFFFDNSKEEMCEEI